MGRIRINLLPFAYYMRNTNLSIVKLGRQVGLMKKIDEKFLNVLNKQGWSVGGYCDDGLVELRIYSPAGQDFSICVSAEELPHAVLKAASSFDIDDHVREWLMAKKLGAEGVPSARELVNDTEAIAKMLNELASALFEAGRASSRTPAQSQSESKQTGEAAPDAVQKKPRDNFLAGGYVLLETHAALSDEEANALKDTDEVPTAYIAVKEDYLREYIHEEFSNLEEFLDEYTYDTIEDLEAMAELNRALAFTYRADADTCFDFPEVCQGGAMLAFADFLSGKLQDEGHEEASKFLDCMLGV